MEGSRGEKVNTFETEMDEAARKAISSLARYKFMSFGYWAAIWVHLNRVSGLKRPNPFGRLVRFARAEQAVEFSKEVVE